ncbi:MAG: hypothetical protein Q9165_003306 [Trypethelium subeluteriae]
MFFLLLQQLCCILLNVGCPTPEAPFVPPRGPVVLPPTYFEIIDSLAQILTIDAPPTYHDIIMSQARVKTIDAPPPATTWSFDWGQLFVWLLVVLALVCPFVVVWVVWVESAPLFTTTQRIATTLSAFPLDLARLHLLNRQLEHTFQQQVLGLQTDLELQFLRFAEERDSLQRTIDLLRESRKRSRMLKLKLSRSKQELLVRQAKDQAREDKTGSESAAAAETPVEPVELSAPGSPKTGEPANAAPLEEPLPEVPVAALEEEQERNPSPEPEILSPPASPHPPVFGLESSKHAPAAAKAAALAMLPDPAVVAPAAASPTPPPVQGLESSKHAPPAAAAVAKAAAVAPAASLPGPAGASPSSAAPSSAGPSTEAPVGPAQKGPWPYGKRPRGTRGAKRSRRGKKGGDQQEEAGEPSGEASKA